MKPPKKDTVKKLEIDQALSVLFDMTRPEVSALTDAFVKAIMGHLIDDKEVHVNGFGTFRVSCRRGKRATRTVLTKGSFKPGEKCGTLTVMVPRKYYVNFRRSLQFTALFHQRFGKMKAEEDSGEARSRRVGKRSGESRSTGMP